MTRDVDPLPKQLVTLRLGLGNPLKATQITHSGQIPSISEGARYRHISLGREACSVLLWASRFLEEVVTYPSFKEALVAFYDAQASEREQRGLREGRADLRERFVQRLRDEGRGTLIDLGAGPGHDAVAFSREGIQVTAIDLSAQHVALCRAKGIDARVGDFYTLDFRADSFQAGWAMSSLLHVPNRDLDAVVGEITRVLCPDAPLAIGLWGGIDREGIWEDDIAQPRRFFSLRSDDHLRALLSKHFEILEFDVGSPEEGLGSKVHYQWCVVTARSDASHIGGESTQSRRGGV